MKINKIEVFLGVSVVRRRPDIESKSGDLDYRFKVLDTGGLKTFNGTA